MPVHLVVEDVEQLDGEVSDPDVPHAQQADQQLFNQFSLTLLVQDQVVLNVFLQFVQHLTQLVTLFEITIVLLFITHSLFLPVKEQSCLDSISISIRQIYTFIDIRKFNSISPHNSKPFSKSLLPKIIIIYISFLEINKNERFET